MGYEEFRKALGTDSEKSSELATTALKYTWEASQLLNPQGLLFKKGQAILEAPIVGAITGYGAETIARKGTLERVVGAGRGALEALSAGKPPSGEEQLKAYGVKKPGFWASFGTEAVTSPSTYLGGIFAGGVKTPVETLTTALQTRVLKRLKISDETLLGALEKVPAFGEDLRGIARAVVEKKLPESALTDWLSVIRDVSAVGVSPQKVTGAVVKGGTEVFAKTKPLFEDIIAPPTSVMENASRSVISISTGLTKGEAAFLGKAAGKIKAGERALRGGAELFQKEAIAPSRVRQMNSFQAAIKGLLAKDTALEKAAASENPISALAATNPVGKDVAGMIWNSILARPESVLNKLGPEGKQLAKLILTYYDKSPAFVGKLSAAFRGVAGKAIKDENIGKISKAMEGIVSPETLTPIERSVFNELMRTMGEKESILATKAGKAGLVGFAPSGGVRGIFEGLKGYWGGKYTKDSLEKMKAPEMQLKMQDFLMSRGAVKSRAEASELLRAYMLKQTGPRVGEQIGRIAGLREFLREQGIDVSRKVEDVYDHLESLGDRAIKAEVFGPKNERLYELLGKIQLRGYGTGVARRIVDAVAGETLVNPVAEKIFGAARGFSSATKLGFGTGFLNYLQRFNISLHPAVTIGSAAKGFKLASTEEGLLTAMADLGLRPPDAGMSKQLASMLEGKVGASGEISAFLMRVYGMRATEFGNRVRADLSGRFAAENLTKKLLASPKSGKYIRWIRSLGLDPTTIKTRGGLTLEDFGVAGRRIVRDTQFDYSVFFNPIEWGRTPLGKTLTQFKPAAYQQTQLIWNSVVKEAVHGNIVPLIKAITVLSASGELNADFREVLSGRNPLKSRPKNLGLRLIENMSRGAGFGMVSDVLFLITQGSPEWVGSLILGPSVSTLTEGMRAGIESFQHGKARPLKKFLTSQVSRGASNLIFPSKRFQKKSLLEGHKPSKAFLDAIRKAAK